MRHFYIIAGLIVTTSVWADEPAKEPYRIPEHVFAGEVKGPYRTGTFEELWIDTQREETTTSDPADKRHLMVQIWYPAEFKGDPERAPYALHRELYVTDEWEAWLDEVKAVRTTSVLKASLAAQPKPFPVLIYNPGGGHPHFSATFQTEFLASHGYVVVGIGHTGLNRIERFPDGYVYKPDVSDPDLSEAQTKGLSAMESFQLQVKRYTELMMSVQVQDIRFVLDRLQALNATRGNRFYQRLNLDHVGALGWSLGGALSLQASRDEPRIKAAANLDGWLYTDVADTGTHRPVLLMHEDNDMLTPASSPAAQRELASFSNSLFWRLLSRSDADWYDVTLRHTNHGHFSDRTLFEPAGLDLMHPRLAHEIVNAYTLEFFDKYLRGRADTPLLAGKSAYPDVALIMKPPK